MVEDVARRTSQSRRDADGKPSALPVALREELIGRKQVTDIAYYFADVILPDAIEIFANEPGRQAIENLAEGPVDWDDFAIEAPGWHAADLS